MPTPDKLHEAFEAWHRAVDEHVEMMAQNGARLQQRIIRVEPPIGARQDAGSDFDHPGPRRQDHVVTDQVARHRRIDLSRRKRGETDPKIR